MVIHVMYFGDMMATQQFTMKMPVEDYAQLRMLAEEENRGMSDVMRTALKEYAAKKGHKLKGRVQRGGNRRQQSESN
jgi:hypothetical protein